MKAADGKTMTTASRRWRIDSRVRLHGTDDEAWFFATRPDGKIDLKSPVPRTLQGRVSTAPTSGAI